MAAVTDSQLEQRAAGWTPKEALNCPALEQFNKRLVGVVPVLLLRQSGRAWLQGLAPLAQSQTDAALGSGVNLPLVRLVQTGGSMSFSAAVAWLCLGSCSSC